MQLVCVDYTRVMNFIFGFVVQASLVCSILSIWREQRGICSLFFMETHSLCFFSAVLVIRIGGILFLFSYRFWKFSFTQLISVIFYNKNDSLGSYWNGENKTNFGERSFVTLLGNSNNWEATYCIFCTNDENCRFSACWL